MWCFMIFKMVQEQLEYVHELVALVRFAFELMNMI